MASSKVSNKTGLTSCTMSIMKKIRTLLMDLPITVEKKNVKKKIRHSQILKMSFFYFFRKKPTQKTTTKKPKKPTKKTSILNSTVSLYQLL